MTTAVERRTREETRACIMQVAWDLFRELGPRTTVILVEQIESDVRERGLTRREAIVFSTMRRARPVALTALAAILAMIPLSESAFWGPMALTIMGGLSVATFLTLFLLPSIYALWHRRSLGPEGAGAKTRREPSFDAFGAAAAAE